jgi:hypothetical protein
MKRGWDATRRNRNIGTAKQGLGQDNRLVIPWCGLKIYYQNLTEYKTVLRSVHSRSLPFIVERTRDDSYHVCTIDDIARVLQHAPSSDFQGVDFIVLRQPKRKEYRTLLHEIGHSVDNDRNPVAFNRKSPLEKETFAHQYADKLRASLVRFGIIPFARMFDKKTIARDGLPVSDFTVD